VTRSALSSVIMMGRIQCAQHPAVATGARPKFHGENVLTVNLWLPQIPYS